MKILFFIKRLPVKPPDTVKILDEYCLGCGGELRIRTEYKLSSNKAYWFGTKLKYCKYCGFSIGAGK